MNVNATPFIPRGYGQPVSFYPCYYVQQPMVVYVPVTIYPQPYAPFPPYDPYFTNANVAQPSEEPRGLSIDEIQRMETIDYLSQQKEWTPLWSELFDLAKKEAEERDLNRFFEQEDRRKFLSNRICRERNLLHPVPSKEVSIDVLALEKKVNPVDNYYTNPENHTSYNELLYSSV